MQLRELYVEQAGKEVSFALGRLNPATTGHGLLVEALKQGPGDAILFLTDRAAKLPTDPLNPNEKLDWARKSFPDIKIELSKNIMFAASDLYARGYSKVTFFEGEDKLGKLLEKYNGVKRDHGFFDFEEIKFERLSRNPDADDATGMSASKMRQAVMDNNFEAFSKGVTKSAQPYAKKMFDNLSTILGSKEEQVEENVLSVASGVFKVGKFLWSNKWLITFSIAAWKGISWISDAIEAVQEYLDNPIVKGLLKYGLPAVGVAMALYGGKKLYDELVAADGDKGKMKDVVENFKPDEKHISDLEKELRAELKAA